MSIPHLIHWVRYLRNTKYHLYVAEIEYGDDFFLVCRCDQQGEITGWYSQNRDINQIVLLLPPEKAKHYYQCLKELEA